MTETEALKLALEALKLIAAQDQGCGGTYTEAEAWKSAQSIALRNIPAIKEALAQPEQEIDPSTTFDEVAKGLQVSRMAIAALDALTIEQRRSINEPLLKAQLFLKAAARVFKEALAQPEQEPVAWVSKRDLFQMIHAKVSNVVVCEKDRVHTEPLYTNPPQRKPLTDEQIHKASTQAGMQEHYMGFHSGFIRFAREIEAAHGIKE